MNCFWLQTQRGDAKLERIVAHLRCILEWRGAFARSQQRRIHLANGVLHLGNERQLTEFSPRLISRNASPVSYAARATCNRFLDELLCPAVQPDDVTLIQKYGGMCLLGHNLIQRFVIVDGVTERGKTQFANVIEEIVGHENVSQLRTRFLEDRFEIFRFLKKTLLIGVDVGPNFLSTQGAGVLKGLVGGDLFDAEQKFGTGSFPVRGNFCVLITSNSRLRIRLVSDVGAWRRRILIVRYDAPRLQKKIPDFGQLLVREEGAGILNFFIEGLEMLMRTLMQPATSCGRSGK